MRGKSNRDTPFHGCQSSSCGRLLLSMLTYRSAARNTPLWSTESGACGDFRIMGLSIPSPSPRQADTSGHRSTCVTAGADSVASPTVPCFQEVFRKPHPAGLHVRARIHQVHARPRADRHHRSSTAGIPEVTRLLNPQKLAFPTGTQLHLRAAHAGQQRLLPAKRNPQYPRDQHLRNRSSTYKQSDWSHFDVRRMTPVADTYSNCHDVPIDRHNSRP